MVMENLERVESGVGCQVRYEKYQSMEGESVQMTIVKWVGRSVMKFVITRSKFTNICNFLMMCSHSLFPSVQLEICMFNCRKRCRKQQAYSKFLLLYNKLRAVHKSTVNFQNKHRMINL